MSLNWIIVFLIDNHLSTSLLAILDLLELDRQKIIELLKVLLHVILLHPQTNIDVLLFKLRVDILVKHFNSFMDITYFRYLCIHLCFAILKLLMSIFGAVVQLTRE